MRSWVLVLYINKGTFINCVKIYKYNNYGKSMTFSWLGTIYFHDSVWLNKNVFHDRVILYVYTIIKKRHYWYNDTDSGCPIKKSVSRCVVDTMFGFYWPNPRCLHPNQYPTERRLDGDTSRGCTRYTAIKIKKNDTKTAWLNG